MKTPGTFKMGLKARADLQPSSLGDNFHGTRRCYESFKGKKAAGKLLQQIFWTRLGVALGTKNMCTCSLSLLAAGLGSSSRLMQRTVICVSAQ